jgi:chitinase
MADPKEVSVTINDRFLTIDLKIEDEDLINSIFAGVALYVRKGLPVKVRQSYVTFSGSQEILTKFMTKTEHVTQWNQETKQILSLLKRR